MTSHFRFVEDYNFPENHLPYGSVRVITILPQDIQKDEVFCEFKYDEEIWNTRAKSVDMIHEHFDMKYSASFVVCILMQEKTKRQINLPEQVSILYYNEDSMRAVTAYVDIR